MQLTHDLFAIAKFLLVIVIGCQYQSNRKPGKTRLGNDVLCVELDVKFWTISLT